MQRRPIPNPVAALELNADLPYNLTMMGLFLVQFFSVHVFLFGIKAVSQG